MQLAGAHPEAAAPTPAQLLVGHPGPGVPLVLQPADSSPPVAGGGAASARPGRDCARAGGVGVRQGGTALNALDSPAPAPSPPSSTDSWGLCFLHPPGPLRSAPTAARDSPSATAAAPPVHPGELAAPPFPGGAE